MESDKQLGRLQEFSEQLTERLKAAPAAPGESMRLAVRIGSKAFLVQMATAGEIVPLSEIAPVPWTKPWFRGLANVRGRLVGVIDLPHFDGTAPLPAGEAQQMLVLSESLKSNVALLVTRAFGLRNMKELDRLDSVSDGARPWEIARFRDLDGVVFTELDLARLVTSERFSSIGA